MAAALTISAVAAIPFGPSAAEDHAAEPPPATIPVTTPYQVTSTSLPGGMVTGEIIRDGEVFGTYIARSGTDVELVEVMNEDGTVFESSIVLTPPDAHSFEETMQNAEAFGIGMEHVRAFAANIGILLTPQPGLDAPVTSDATPAMSYTTLNSESRGRHALSSVTIDGSSAADGGGSRPGYIWDSGCATIKDKGAPWHGCFERWTVDDRMGGYWYSGDQSQSTGHGTFWHALTYGKTEHRYGSEGLVTSWKPGSDQNAGKCRTVTMSLEMEATKMSDTHEVCPSRIRPSVSNTLFKAVWEGHNHGGAVEATAMDFARAPDGRGSGFQYWVGRGRCTC